MFKRAQETGLLQAVIVTVCVDPALADRLTRAIERMPWLTDISHLDSYSSATRRPAFGPQMKAAPAALAFIDYTQNVEQAIDSTQYLVQTFGSKLAVVAIGEDRDPQFILEAMRAGCSEYLPVDVTDLALAETLHRLSHRWSVSVSRTSQDGSLLALIGAKGGVGTTSLAVHLALYLTVQHGKRVLLVDSQPELGHVCIYLGLDGTQFTLSEVVRNVNRLDSDLLQGYVAKHPSGLAVLSSPDVSGHTRPNDPSAVARTLDFLRSEYDYVVMDCGQSFDDTTRMAIDAASRIYLVATPEVSAIRDMSRHIDRVLQNSQASERLNVVLNRYMSSSGLDVLQIEKALRLPVTIRIPNNYPALVKAGNLGQPIAPDSSVDVAHEIKRWAASLVGVPQKAPAARRAVGSFRSLFTGKSGELQREGATA